MTCKIIKINDFSYFFNFEKTSLKKQSFYLKFCFQKKEILNNDFLMEKETLIPINSYEDEQNEQPTFCNLCQELPEEYIALSCGHNFCLLCLTKVCFQSSPDTPSKLLKLEINQENNSEEFHILCPIDNQTTPLNISSIEALNKVRENFTELENKKKPLYNEVIFEESAENFHTTDEFARKKRQKMMNGPPQSNLCLDSKKNSRNIFSPEQKHKYLDNNFNSAKELNDVTSQLSSTPIKQANAKIKRKSSDIPLIFCPIHQNEEPIIVCFSCGNRPLCVECVVNGDHKNHEMANVNKIKDSCKEALVFLKPEIEQKEKEFGIIIERLITNKKLISDKIWEVKCKISDDINELKERLSNKENELLMAKDCEASEKFTEIDGYITEFQEKIFKLQEFQKNLKMKSEHSESFSEGIDLLNYFTDNKQEIFNYFNDESPNIAENMEEFNVEINKDNYLIYLENLHNLQLASSKLNIVNLDEKVQTSHKFFQSNSLTKVNVEKSVTLNEKNKEKSTFDDFNRHRQMSEKTKEIHHSIKIFESPLKNGQFLNSSLNLSFINENNKFKTKNLFNRRLIKANETFTPNMKENCGIQNYLSRLKNERKFSTNIKKPLKGKESLLNITKALERQKEKFQRKKHGL